MTLLIKKVGGSILKSKKDMDTLADYLIPFSRTQQLVVVVSAFSGCTDRLMAETESASSEAYELLLSLGEQYACAHLGLVLQQRRVPYRIFCGKEVGIVQKSDGNFWVDMDKYRQALATAIVIVSGFQVLNEQRQLHNLGRGGSDLTALILAQALQAEQCTLLKDVPGIYNLDPALGPLGKFFDILHFQDLKNFLRFQKKIIQRQAALFSLEHQQPFSVANLTGLQTQICAQPSRLRADT